MLHPWTIVVEKDAQCNYKHYKKKIERNRYKMTIV